MATTPKSVGFTDPALLNTTPTPSVAKTSPPTLSQNGTVTTPGGTVSRGITPVVTGDTTTYNQAVQATGGTEVFIVSSNNNDSSDIVTVYNTDKQISVSALNQTFNSFNLTNTNSYGNSNVAAFLPTFTGNLSAGGLSVSGVSDLGDLSNIYIGGGTNGQVLTTNGSGALTWSDVSSNGGGLGNIIINGDNISSTNNIVNIIGNNYVQIQSNGNSWQFGSDGNLTLPSNTSSINYANGSPYGGSGNGSYGNSNVVSLLTSFGSNTITTTGNVRFGNVNTSGLITSTGNIRGGNLVTTGALSVTGNANVGNIGAAAGLFTNISGTLTTQIQPNITSTGTLTTLSVSGNSNIANIGVGGLITAVGNITGGNLITGGIISSTGNSNVGNLGTTGVFATTLSVSGNSNIGNIGTGGLITATGNITGGNLSTPGNLSVTGNIIGGNIIGVLANGNSNVNIATANGNVTITSNGNKTWTFDTTGNLNTAGNIVGPASANFTIFSNGGAHDFTFAQDGTFYAPDDVVLGGNSIYIGPGANTLTQLSNAVMVASSNSNAYIQAVINNVSDNGSADWVATGHLGNDTGGWADIGFTSSGFGDSNYTITGQGDGYVFAQSYVSGQAPGGRGGNLVLATGENGTVNDIIFGTGGFLTSNIFGRISDANNALELSRTNSNLSFSGGGGIIGNGNLYIYPDSANTTDKLDIYLSNGPDIHIDRNSDSNLIIGSDNGANVTVEANGNVYIQSFGSTANIWNFDSVGNLTLPRGGVVYETDIPGGALSGNTIALVPSGGTSADQQLLIYPTTADANHLHLTTGNLYSTELFLGDDNLYVKLAITGDVVINSDNGNGNSAMWTFDTTGNLTLPRDVVANTDPIFVISGGATPTIRSDDASLAGPANLAISADYLNLSGFTGNKIVFYADTGQMATDANMVLTTNLANTGNTSSWTFGTDGNLTVPGGGALWSTGTNTVALTSNITDPELVNLSLDYGNSVATLSANISVYIQTNGGASSWNFNPDGDLTVPGMIVAGGPTSSFSKLDLVTEGANTAYLTTTNNDTTALYLTETTAELYANTTVSIFANTGGTSKEWLFDSNGNLTFPDGSIQSTAPVAEAPFNIQAINFTAIAGARYGVNTSGGAVTATLPATPATGVAVFFADAGGAYSTNNLTINRNGETIMDSATNLVVSTNNQSVGLFYNGTTWRIYNAG